MGASQTIGSGSSSAVNVEAEVKIPSLALSQPKNYIGVPIAEISSRDTGALVMGHLTAMAGASKRGAHAFNLIDSDGDVTDWCRGVLSSILTDYTPLEYLRELEDLKNTKGRFIDQRPEWEQFGEAVARQYPATDAVIDILQRTGPVALPELVTHLSEENELLAERLFIKDDTIPAGRGINELSLEDREIYRSVGVCQFKSVLYHLGVLTSAGSSTDYLNPTEQLWDVEPTVSAGGWV
jgi:hypothetical protein